MRLNMSGALLCHLEVARAMPVLSYCAVVGSVLLSLIYFSEALLGPPHQLSISTNFNGLPKPFKLDNGAQILTVRDMPVSRGAAYENALAQTPSTVAPPKTVALPGRKTKKSAKVLRTRRENFAHAAYDNVTRMW